MARSLCEDAGLTVVNEKNYDFMLKIDKLRIRSLGDRYVKFGDALRPGAGEYITTGAEISGRISLKVKGAGTYKRQIGGMAGTPPPQILDDPCTECLDDWLIEAFNEGFQETLRYMLSEIYQTVLHSRKLPKVWRTFNPDYYLYVTKQLLRATPKRYEHYKMALQVVELGLKFNPHNKELQELKRKIVHNIKKGKS